MPPSGGETGRRNADIAIDLGIWARQDGPGVAFDSSTGFSLPNGAMRSPDVSWVPRERLARLNPKQTRGFVSLAPDLAIELAAPSDDFEDCRRRCGNTGRTVSSSDG
jgi:Uma2 family endonuclease